MSAFAHQVDNSAKVRKVTRYDNFTGNTCYSLVIADYPMNEREAKRASIEAGFAEMFNILVLDYGTDLELMNEVAALWDLN